MINKKPYKFKLVLLFFFFYIVGLSHNCVAQDKKDPWEEHPPRTISLNGQILIPKSSCRVGRYFIAKGVVSGKYRHLWLVVRIGRRNWPKEPELIPDLAGQWRGEVFEGGRPPEGIFELLLVDVSEETNRIFHKWLLDGHRSGSYPGISSEDLKSAIILDQKQCRIIVE